MTEFGTTPYYIASFEKYFEIVEYLNSYPKNIELCFNYSKHNKEKDFNSMII